MNKYGNGIAYNVMAGLVMLVPAMMILFDGTDFLGGSKVFLQYALLVCGAVYLLAFVGNKRGYFRPGWILTQGFIQFFIGLFMLFCSGETFNDEIASVTFGIWAIATASAQISGGIQLRALEVKRWKIPVYEGVINIVWAFILLVNPFQTYDYLWLIAGLFLGTISVCTVLEVMVHKVIV
ncbi:MAG: hypothetical protein E7388_03645 [Ruminococcaceae bacterium]|nr:hypothetical protein [Oscillospiraceae bacterium]